MKTENLSTLKIHELTQEQYERELEAGNLEEYALYLTPDNNIPFQAIYNETLYENIRNAFEENNGRRIFVIYQYEEYTTIIADLVSVNNDYCKFSAITSEGIYEISCDLENNWNLEVQSFEVLRNLLASI